MPPLGLITVASMLPSDWEIRLVDRNVKLDTDADWDWCDMVMISAMIVQRDDFRDVIRKGVAKGKRVAVGGPFPTSVPEFAQAAGAHYLILDEGEMTIPMFLEAVERGEMTGTFRSLEKPDVTQTPMPRYDLLDLKSYFAMTVQFSRGCPFQCEFCDIITLYGRKPRTKTPEQMLAEFEALYDLGWGGLIFVVDDNFIGNKRNAKVFLRALIPWMQEHGYPFTLMTEASLNLAEDDEMIELMVQAGFSTIFMGIETPDADSLAVANKEQNTRGSLTEACNKITRAGIEITSGFILGFDGERAGAGRRIFDFVQETGIPQAHLGMLTALPNTAMWQRLKQEGRLLEDFIETDEGTESPQLSLMNFVPTRPIEDIAADYVDTFWDLYEPRTFMDRTFRHMMMAEGKPEPDPNITVKVRPWHDLLGILLIAYIRMFAIITWRYGVVRSRTRFAFWKQAWTVLRQRPHMFTHYMSNLGFGEHFFVLREEVRASIEGQLASRQAALDALGVTETGQKKESPQIQESTQEAKAYAVS
jgi:radical SAM superfamily enzyme YgiQ (UPF0313 family)